MTAGKVDICCFDKTGTLTSDEMNFEGVAILGGELAPGEGELLKGESLTEHMLHVLAACQSLVSIDGMLVGDPVEKAGLAAIGWSYGGNDVVSSKVGDRKRLRILHRCHFSSELKRMSVVVHDEDLESEGPPPSYALAKGAPEVLRDLLGIVPEDYDRTHKYFASQGSRVLTLAYKPLDSNLSTSDVRGMPRAEIESNLIFVGFAVFACPTKPQSEPTLRMLTHSDHACTMVRFSFAALFLVPVVLRARPRSADLAVQASRMPGRG
ncbi:hypothetical protein CYMTET_25836 [Cymbomonas tetramitiformis]|uniref:Uncharacterized protein n=1 Tax=Cymbomonas tetramitiformis TaxID=36881 RepID=A0AAE0KYJ1_9CHLO|nr:hypothetical protein CYMTET_25836 [Cymbomonas tetramitiformis]